MSDDLPPPPPPDDVPLSPPPPPGPSCPNHPQREANVACSRCGTLVCALCVADSPAQEPVCAPCMAAYGMRAVARPGATVDAGACLQRAWDVFKLRWPLLVSCGLVMTGIEIAGVVPPVVLQALAA